MRRLAWLIVAAVAGCTAQYSCGNKRSVDRAKLEEQVQAWVTETGGNPTRVACPDKAPKNTMIGCEVELDGEKTYFVDVDDGDPDDPDLHWRGGAGFYRSELAAHLRDKVGLAGATLECQPLLYWGVAAEIRCGVTAGAARTTAIVGRDSSFRFDPPLINTDLVEQSLAERYGPGVDCPPSPVARAPDGVLLCDFAGPPPQKVRIVYDAELEPTSVELVPP